METPAMDAVVGAIGRKNPLQKKALDKYLSTVNEQYLSRAENFFGNARERLPEIANAEALAEGYIGLCKMMLSEKMRYKRTGEYSCPSAAQALVEVYDNPEVMRGYMLGLATSLFLWPNHYAMFSFFISRLEEMDVPASLMEIGPGHGLYLLEALKKFPQTHGTAVDVSKTSIEISREMIAAFAPDATCQFLNIDAKNLDSGSYDMVIACEILEHVDDPVRLLSDINKLLPSGGHLFVTTCANSPAVDHVYHYTSVDHMRRHVTEAGFQVSAELALAVEDLPPSEWEESQAEINYAVDAVKL